MSYLWIVLALVAACDGSTATIFIDAGPDAPADAVVAGSALIGSGGGTVVVAGGPTVTIPPGALDHDVTITVKDGGAPPPGSVSALWAFGPAGTVFARPVTIQLPVLAGSNDVDVYWSNHDSTGFEPLGAIPTAGSTMTAQVFYFGDGYVTAASPTRTVSGSSITTFVRPGGITNQPQAVSGTPPAALVPDGSGGFTTITGVAYTDGTFTILGVPAGTYVLKLGSDYFVTSASAIDGGDAQLGRADATPPATSATITLDLTNLTTWASGDQLEAYSAEADAWYFDLEQHHAISASTTALASYAFTTADGTNSRLDPPNLIVMSKGDNLSIAQLTPQTSTESTPYLAMTKYDSALIQQVDGSNLDVAGAFADVSTANTLTATVRASQFEAAAGYDGTHGTAINPTATVWAGLPATAFSVLGLPASTAYGVYCETADYLQLRVALGGGDVTGTNMGYGTPGVGTWKTIGDARIVFSTAVTATGATTPAAILSVLGQADAIASLTAAPVVPALTPPRAPKLGTADAFTPQTGVGLSPTIAWTAPATGTPSVYQLRLHALANASGATVDTVVATFETTATSVQVPPGVLQTGQQYVLQIAATSRPDPSTPRRMQFPDATAEVVTAIFTP